MPRFTTATSFVASLRDPLKKFQYLKKPNLTYMLADKYL